MSEMSKSARQKAKAKIGRLTARTDPKARVDASDYTPPGAMEADVATGPRPISRRQFRSGGKVQGEKAKGHMGRKPRKAGGGAGLATALINEDVKESNKSRDGDKHVGGMKKGGRAHKLAGGPLTADTGSSTLPPTVVGRKVGGRSCHAAGGSASKPAQDLAQSAMRMTAKQGYDPQNSQPQQAANYQKLWKMRGGAPGKKSGGGILDGGTRPVGGRSAHASGGRAKKGGTNVNIIITPGANSTPKPPMGPPPGAMAPPGAVGMHQGMPPPAAPPPMGAPTGGPPMMGRKSGGRAYPITDGAGGGKGRLQKARAYG